MITVENLTKDYGTTRAVDHLSFSLTPGKVTGFLGPNGSGKSTTMRCIVGLDSPTSGRCLIEGKQYKDLASPMATVGSLLDGKAFHPARSARTQLEVVAASNGIPKQRVNEVLEFTGITKVAKQRLKGFSLGMGQRLGIAIALLGDPRILILDEPVNGLDPDGVRWVRSMVRQLADEGRTVLISSHLMSEMAVTADELVVLGKGKLIAQGPISQFTQAASHTRVRVTGPDVEAMARALAESGLNPDRRAPMEGYPQGYIELLSAEREKVGHLLYTKNVELHELTEIHASLEDVFMELTADQVEYNSGGANVPSAHNPAARIPGQPGFPPMGAQAPINGQSNNPMGGN